MRGRSGVRSRRRSNVDWSFDMHCILVADAAAYLPESPVNARREDELDNFRSPQSCQSADSHDQRARLLVRLKIIDHWWMAP